MKLLILQKYENEWAVFKQKKKGTLVHIANVKGKMDFVAGEPANVQCMKYKVKPTNNCKSKIVSHLKKASFYSEDEALNYIKRMYKFKTKDEIKNRV